MVMVMMMVMVMVIARGPVASKSVTIVSCVCSPPPMACLSHSANGLSLAALLLSSCGSRPDIRIRPCNRPKKEGLQGIADENSQAEVLTTVFNRSLFWANIRLSEFWRSTLPLEFAIGQKEGFESRV